MALMGGNPQWVQNLGDAFLAQPQDVMDSGSDCGNLAQQPARQSSTEQKIITITKKIVPVNQPANAPTTIKYRSYVVAEPVPTVIAIESANPDVVIELTQTWFTQWPIIRLIQVSPAVNRLLTSVRGFTSSTALLPRTITASTDDDDQGHHHHIRS